MLNLVLWLGLLAGFFLLVGFAWRSAMRRRGYRLLKLLEGEQVLRYAVDVPIVIGDRPARPALFARRGTVVLTRKRLAGFTHRSRFVLVRGGGKPARRIRADDGWLVIQPASSRRKAGAMRTFRFQVPDAEEWSREVSKVLKV